MHVEYGIELVEGTLVERLLDRVAGIVHEDVDCAELVSHTTLERLERIRGSQVHHHRQATLAQRCDRFVERFASPAGDDNAGPGCDQTPGNRESDAAATPGNQRQLSVEPECVLQPGIHQQATRILNVSDRSCSQ